MSLAFDCDGVLQDFASAMDAKVLELFGVVADNTKYHLHDRYTLSATELQFLQQHIYTDDFVENLNSIPYAIETAIELQQHNRVIVVTAIPAKLQNARLASFKRYGFTPDAIYCVGHTPKTAVYEKEKPHIVFDDQHSHLLEALPYSSKQICINDNIPQSTIVDVSFQTFKSVKEWSFINSNR